MAVQTRHTRCQLSTSFVGADCSNRACDGGTKGGEFYWEVRGDIEYEALCAKCHERLFPAIDYAMRRDG